MNRIRIALVILVVASIASRRLDGVRSAEGRDRHRRDGVVRRAVQDADDAA